MNSWQLKVFVRTQSSAQLFVDGLATAHPGRRRRAVTGWPSRSAANRRMTSTGSTRSSQTLALPALDHEPGGAAVYAVLQEQLSVRQAAQARAVRRHRHFARGAQLGDRLRSL